MSMKYNGELPKLESKDERWLRAVDLLRTIPAFETRVKRIRERHGIEPSMIKKELERHLGAREFTAFTKIEYPDWSGLLEWPSISNENLKRLRHKKKQWEHKKFPFIGKEISRLRLAHLGKIPLDWSNSIVNYILYDQISYHPFLSRATSRMPEISIEKDAESQEPFVSLKIYGNTDLGIFCHKRALEKIQKLLPTYQLVNRKIYDTTYRRWVYYFARKKAGMKHNEANALLINFGFAKIDYQYASQEMKRFENLFVIQKPRKKRNLIFKN